MSASSARGSPTRTIQEYAKLFKDNQHDKEKLSQLFNVTVFIGVTGTGKSHTAQSLTGLKEKFKTSSGTESETLKVGSVISHWQSQEDTETDSRTRKPTVFIDTPGLGDTKGRDTEHIAEIVTSLKKLGFVHCFVLVLNS